MRPRMKYLAACAQHVSYTTLGYLVKDESWLKTKIHIFPIFSVKFHNFTELWKH